MRKNLADYHAKRDFRRTPEPPPGKVRTPGERPVFVIHRHEATRLHYDLRLEMDGALRSFAVPRGLSYQPTAKHLAVRTEDHPLSYESFEGVIPKGQYGAGTMKIWDRGEYELLYEEEGKKLEIRLFGTRARGEWHLVKTLRDEKEWLLFKARDAYARADDERAFPFDLDLAACGRGRLGAKAAPMRPRDEVAAFSDGNWVFEADLTGIRAFAVGRCGAVRLVGADDGREVTGNLDSVRESLAKVHAEEFRLDGVLVALDESERPSKDALRRTLEGEGGPAIVYYAFDILHYDDLRVRELPLLDRKRLLASLLPPDPRVAFVDHVSGDGIGLSETVSRAGLRGVIAKKAASRYRGGRSAAWRRIPSEAAPSPDRRRLSETLARGAGRGAGRVRYTNRDKVFWPEKGYTKGDLLDYYENVAEHILPHLFERPIHMRRFPDGIDGKSFYHKNAPGHVPDWVETEPIPNSKGEVVEYVVVNDRETLLLLANLGSVDLHPWMSRRGSLDTPDRVVFDLDPDGSAFSRVVKTAREVGKVLRGIGLRPLLKTSGQAGLHVVVPLLPRYTYDQSRMFAEMVARVIVRDHPDVCTVERAVSRRRGRVYIDFLQNRRGQTVVPPYVLRPVPAASVSTPIEWDELGSGLDPAAFNLKSLPDRVRRLGDLHRPVLTDLQDLAPAIAAFQEAFA